MITAIYIPLTPLKEYLNCAEATDLVRDINGTHYVYLLTNNTEQRIRDDVQMIRMKSIETPCKP